MRGFLRGSGTGLVLFGNMGPEAPNCTRRELGFDDHEYSSLYRI
jgi:hypothetical protein